MWDSKTPFPTGNCGQLTFPSLGTKREQAAGRPTPGQVPSGPQMCVGLQARFPQFSVGIVETPLPVAILPPTRRCGYRSGILSAVLRMNPPASLRGANLTPKQQKWVSQKCLRRFEYVFPQEWVGDSAGPRMPGPQVPVEIPHVWVALPPPQQVPARVSAGSQVCTFLFNYSWSSVCC